jgi:radical SAM superfamily enzyme YgiQ (UPF0313 family)
MNILLVSAVNTHIEIEVRYPQLGLGYLVNYARQKLGPDTHTFKIITAGMEETLEDFKPDLVGISSFSQNYGIVIQYARMCRARHIPVIVGGIHISMLPASLTDEMDVGVLFEGEQTFAELIELYSRTGTFEPSELDTIRGICYRLNGKPVFTPSRPLIENLDTIPRPARELLNLQGSHLSMFTSRGCPYRCVFCASSRFWNTTRLASAQYVVDEIKELYYNYGAKLISFYDDLFIVNKQRLENIVQALAGEKLLGKVRFSCSARANLIDDKTAALLKEMGVVSVALGLESGHPRILTYLKSGNVTPEQNTLAVHTLDRYGIAPNAAFVIGAPDETKDEIMTTYRFIKSIPLRNFNVYVMTPFPGTPIWSEALERGLISDDFDNWPVLDTVHFSRHYQKAILMSRTLSRREMHTLYRTFQRLRYWTYFKNAYRHPFTKDLPRMALALAKEKICRLVGQ